MSISKKLKYAELTPAALYLVSAPLEQIEAELYVYVGKPTIALLEEAVEYLRGSNKPDSARRIELIEAQIVEIRFYERQLTQEAA